MKSGIIFQFEGKKKMVELEDQIVKDTYINFLEKQSGAKTVDIEDNITKEQKEFTLADNLIPSSYEIANFIKKLPDNFKHTTDTISEQFYGYKVNYSVKDKEQQRLIRKYYATINRARDSIEKELKGKWTDIPFKGRLRLFIFKRDIDEIEEGLQNQQSLIEL